MKATEVLGSLDTAELRVRLHPIDPEHVSIRTPPLWLRPVWPGWAAAMTVVRVVYVRQEVLETWDDQRLARLIAHELVHVRQWRTDGFVGFVRHYLADYVRGRRAKLGHRGAYKAIGYEAEAYGIEEIL